MRWWHWALIGVAAIFLLNLFIPRQSAYAPTQPATTSAITPQTETASVAPTPPPMPTTRWNYNSQRDEMRSATDRFATTDSLNTENLGFPYESVRMSIMLRHSARYGKDIILVLSDGQFQCRFDGCTISAKFDDGPIQTFSVNESDGGRNDALFIVNQTRFLAALRRAEHATIEARLYPVGAQQFSFDVAGLEWED